MTDTDVALVLPEAGEGRELIRVGGVELARE